MQYARDLSAVVGVARACDALAIPRASFYRWVKPGPGEDRPRPSPPRALGSEERQQVLATLNSPEFRDKAPAEVYASLLDDGTYLCSVRTMYRILGEVAEVRERRDQLRHPAYKKPELLATAPNQVWSWDITKLLGPAKWTYFYLYVIIDVFSRYVVGWLLAQRESAALAQRLIAETIAKEPVDPAGLTIHSDRGPSMSSKPVAQLLADLGVTKSHSRPHVSDDNPFSESQFKTLKYRPEFPERFGSVEDALVHCRHFFAWYNEDHHHSGIALLTPSDVHHGRADAVLGARQQVLDSAYAAHPERFVRRRPTPLPLPEAVWINPPLSNSESRLQNAQGSPEIASPRVAPTPKQDSGLLGALVAPEAALPRHAPARETLVLVPAVVVPALPTIDLPLLPGRPNPRVVATGSRRHPEPRRTATLIH
jgi:putative transposase